MPAAARRFWDFYTEQIALNGTLRPIDGPGLEMVCGLHADVRELERDKRRLLRQHKQQAKADGRKVQGSVLLEFEMTVEARRLETTINGKRSLLMRQCDRYGLNPMAGSRLQANENSGFTPRNSVTAEVNEIESLIQ